MDQSRSEAAIDDPCAYLEMLSLDDSIETQDSIAVKHSKFQSVFSEIRRRQLQFNGTALDIELLQEASKQRLREDDLDRVFDDPMIQLKVRGVLGSDFCDAIGIFYTLLKIKSMI